jgi:sensor domain CHASE-containing protein
MTSSFERRSLIIILLLLTVILFAVGWNADRLLEDFRILEYQDVQIDTQRMQKALQTELSRLSTTVGDYAAWDETYAYLHSFDPDFIVQNFNPPTLVNLKVDYILILDAEGSIVRNLYFNDENSTVTTIPVNELAKINAHRRYLTPRNMFGVRSGYLRIHDSPVAFASCSIVTTQLEGPIRGTLILGRRLDDERLAQLSNEMLFDIYVAPNDAPEAQAVRLDPARSLAVTELSGVEIAGAVRVDDLDGSENFVVAFSRPRAIFANGKSTTNLFLGIFAFCGLVSSLTGYLMIRWLDRAKKRQQVSDQYFSLLAKNSRECVIFSSFPDLQVIAANQAALTSLGYTLEKIVEINVI